MKKIFSIMNDFSAKGVIENYALGGAMALLFYSEPILTYDIDIFLFLNESNNSQLIDLSSVYTPLRQMGYQPKDEYVIIEDMNVQFLPAYNELVIEAVKKAVEKEYENVKVRIIKLEYLIAIMLQTGRPKDKARIGILLDQKIELDQNQFMDILFRYKLKEKWEQIHDTQE